MMLTELKFAVDYGNAVQTLPSPASHPISIISTDNVGLQESVSGWCETLYQFDEYFSKG